MTRTVIATDKAPAALGPYSQGIRVGHLVFTAGQLGIDPATGKLVEGGIEAQTRQALTNLSAILEAAGTSLANVVKVTVFLQNMGDFQAMNGVYAQFFVTDPPARATVEVTLPPDWLVQIETIAVVSS
jgi:2-iminobutanoate/2-iminopropanoate deaminase